MVLIFNKPYGVLSQFTPDVAGQRTLGDHDFPPRVYPLGRLDLDSEGMLLLSDEPGLNTRLLDPRHSHWRRYYAQVEGLADATALQKLSEGVMVQGKMTLPTKCWNLDAEPAFPPRDPPVRFRKLIPTSWMALELHEGRNRQVRRMTAAVGLPTLRLVRVRIGALELSADLAAGAWRKLTPAERAQIFQ